MLVSVLNDALRQSPVLVQAYTYGRAKPETLDLPFPDMPDFSLTASAAAAAGADEPGPADAPAAAAPTHAGHALPALAIELAQTPLAQSAAAALRFNSTCGYLRLLRLNEQWVPLEAHMGIPLFDGALNAAVLQRIEARRLFAAPSPHRHRRRAH